MFFLSPLTRKPAPIHIQPSIWPTSHVTSSPNSAVGFTWAQTQRHTSSEKHTDTSVHVSICVHVTMISVWLPIENAAVDFSDSHARTSTVPCLSSTNIWRRLSSLCEASHDQFIVPSIYLIVASWFALNVFQFYLFSPTPACSACSLLQFGFLTALEPPRWFFAPLVF